MPYLLNPRQGERNGRRRPRPDDSKGHEVSDFPVPVLPGYDQVAWRGRPKGAAHLLLQGRWLPGVGGHQEVTNDSL